MSILSGEKKKETHENRGPEFQPGKAQPLVRKLDNLLAAAQFPGKVFKHGIVPVVLFHGQWITNIEISEVGFYSSMVFTQPRLFRRISLASLGGGLLTNCHHDGSGSASKT